MKKSTIAAGIILILMLSVTASAADYYWNAIGDNPYDSLWFNMTRVDPDDWTQDEFNGTWKSRTGSTGTLAGSGSWWSTNGDSVIATGTFTGPLSGTWQGLFILEDTCYGSFVCLTSNPYITGNFAGYADRSPSPYLIIYADIFDGNTDLTNFADKKRKRGFDVEMKKLGDISGVVYDENPDVEAIRNYIRGWFNPNWVKPSYVLLVGDSKDVTDEPSANRNGWVAEQADYSHIPTYQYLSLNHYSKTSDYYYQLMDEDDTADVALGRWCVVNNTELETMINKTQSYENPNALWEPNRTLFVASYWPTGNSPLKRDCADSSEVIRQYINNLNLPGYDLYTVYGDTIGDPAPNPTNDTIVDYFESNGGVGIVNYIGHANLYPETENIGWIPWTAIGDQSDRTFSAPIVNSLNQTHQGYPLVYQFCCSMGAIAYGENKTLCEYFTLNPNGGAAGALGVSGRGFTGGDQFNTPMVRGIFTAHFEKNLDCGWAIINGGLEFWHEQNIDFTLHDYYDPSRDADSTKKDRINMTYWIGDPELDVWRGAPENATMTIATASGNYVVTVQRTSDSEPVANAEVCMYSDGICHSVARTNANGQVRFPYYSTPGSYTFTAINQIGPICIKPVSQIQTISLSPGVEENSESLKWSITTNSSISTGNVQFSYSTPAAGSVTLKIYDAIGREVKSFDYDHASPGSYKFTWDGMDRNNQALSDGVYFFRFEGNNYQNQGKITLIR